jgi:hypothetical protein
VYIFCDAVRCISVPVRIYNFAVFAFVNAERDVGGSIEEGQETFDDVQGGFYATEVGFFRVSYDEFFLAVVAVFLGAERDRVACVATERGRRLLSAVLNSKSGRINARGSCRTLSSWLPTWRLLLLIWAHSPPRQPKYRAKTNHGMMPDRRVSALGLTQRC